MTYNPADKLQFRVEIRLDGAWVEITSRTRTAGGLYIKHGRSDGAIQGETSRCEITIGNDDAALTEGNPMSPWYPHFGRGTEIRISLIGILVSAAALFTGEIDDIEAVFPDSTHCSIKVEATGAMGAIAQENDLLRSPLFRTMSGVAQGDYVPHAYWSMEDGSETGQFASGLPGGLPVPISELVSPASDATLPGSQALPTLAAGANVTFPVPGYSPTTQWVVQILLKVPSEPGAQTVLLELHTAGGTAAVWKVELSPGAPGFVDLRAYDAAGGSLGVFVTHTFDPPNPESEFYDTWKMFTVAVEDSGGGNLIGWMGYGDGITDSTMTGGADTGTVGTLTSVAIPAPAAVAGIRTGHLAVFTDAGFDINADAFDNASAMQGHTGEQAHERIERLLREEGRASSIAGSTSERMGPQRSASLFDLLLDCERADHGMLADVIDDLAVSYRTRENLYNQTPRVAVTYGALTTDLRPRWNHQLVANDWTVARMNGASARASDEAHVAATRRRSRQSLTINVETDSVLANHAGFRVAVGTAPGPRYTQGGINLRNSEGAKLADSVLALIPGDRMTAAATALPAQHPPGGFDQMVVGWVAELDVYKWLLYPNMVPSSPHSELGVYGTDTTVSRYDSANSYLAAAVDADDTALTVGTEIDHALWITGSSPPTFPFNAGCAGIRLPVSAIASSVLDAFGRSVSNGWGSADSGQAWTTSGGAASDFDVTSSTGRHTNTSANVFRASTLTAGSAEQDYAVDCMLAIGAAAGAEVAHWICARETDTDNHYIARLVLTTGSAVTLQLDKRVAGSVTSLAAAVTIATGHAGGEWYRVRIQALGSVIRAKAWLRTDTEPQVWQLQATDTSLTTGSLLGLRSRRETGNTNTNPVFSWDNLEVFNPQTFTVGRSADGYDKALTSGEQVRLWTPARHGL